MSFGDRNVICCIGYLYCGGYDPNGQEDPSGGISFVGGSILSAGRSPANG